MTTTNASTSFESFLKSDDTLWIISPDGIIFQSQRMGIAPLVCYIERAPRSEDVIAFDKVTGNAAALLMKRANCREVFSSIGSDAAAETLNEFGIPTHFTKTVPHIVNRAGNGMCPFETMSLGKTPDEFYALIKHNPLFEDIFPVGGA